MNIDYQKALDFMLEYTTYECSREHYACIQALKKQIPKRPGIWMNKDCHSPTPEYDWGYECPYCRNREIDYPEHHCICGQALDWSE